MRTGAHASRGSAPVYFPVITGAVERIVHPHGNLRRAFAAERGLHQGRITGKFHVLDVERQVAIHDIGALLKVGRNRRLDRLLGMEGVRSPAAGTEQDQDC